jgi:short-subunit dehydrogenase
MNVRDAVVLVTGASGEIGAACAKELRTRGARLILSARDAALSDLAAEVGAKAFDCDLAQSGAAEQLAADALEVYGVVDAVVHCAGIGWRGATVAMGSDRVDELLGVNLRAPVQLSRRLLPGMLERGRGHLSFVASIAGWLPVAEEAVYSATKSGLLAYAESLRAELHDTGVGVSVVSPAAVRSQFWANRGTPYDRRFPRQMAPERVSRAVVHGIEDELAHQMLPRWLAVAPAIRAAAPRVYRGMQRRFG